MLKKIFIHILFVKKRVLISFIIVFIVLMCIVGVQSVNMVYETSQMAIPDVQIQGKGDEDGIIRFRLYGGLGNLKERFISISNGTMDVYGVVARNIETINSPRSFQQVNYWIYGVEEQFLTNELNSYIKEGRLPEPDKKEVIIGSYAARYFDAKIGRAINIPVTLNEDFTEEDISEYVVSGILVDNLDVYKGAVFVSRESFEQLNQTETNEENQLLIYFNHKQSLERYQDILETQNELITEYQIGSVNEMFHQKENTIRSIMFNYIVVIFFSTMILFTLISYLMKGITKKIGLLKALGISDRTISKVFARGLGIIVIVSYVVAILGVMLITEFQNNNMSKFYGYHVEMFKVNYFVHLVELMLAAVLFFAVFISIRIKSSRISPRDAMLKL